MNSLPNSYCDYWGLGLRFTALFLTCCLVKSASSQTTNATPALAAESLVIIVNRANPVDNLSTEELRRYFLLEREHWPGGRKNTVLMLPSGTAERKAILHQVYNLNDGELNRHFLQANYTGQIHSAPKELANPVNVRKFVFNVPGAIGYVRASEMDDTVKAVRIGGFLPGDAGYPLQLPHK